MWDFSSSTMDQTPAPWIGSRVLTWDCQGSPCLFFIWTYNYSNIICCKGYLFPHQIAFALWLKNQLTICNFKLYFLIDQWALFHVPVHVKSLQLCPTLCDPMDYSLLGYSCLWDFSSKNTGGGCHFLLWGIFPTQWLNLCLLHWQADALPLSHKASLTDQSTKSKTLELLEENIEVIFVTLSWANIPY